MLGGCSHGGGCDWDFGVGSRDTAGCRVGDLGRYHDSAAGKEKNVRTLWVGIGPWQAVVVPENGRAGTGSEKPVWCVR